MRLRRGQLHPSPAAAESSARMLNLYNCGTLLTVGFVDVESLPNNGVACLLLV
jgi:hypothetical protein